MTGNHETPPGARGTSGTVVDLDRWLRRHGAGHASNDRGASAAGAQPRAAAASPEEFLATWLSLLPEGADPCATARALLERYRKHERSPPTLYELRLHELLAAVARSETRDRPRRRRPRGRPAPRRHGEIIAFGRPS